MYTYFVSCRIQEVVEGFFFQSVIDAEQVHNFIVGRAVPITTDADLAEVQRAAQERFGATRKVNGWWGDLEYAPEVQILNISLLSGA